MEIAGELSEELEAALKAEWQALVAQVEEQRERADRLRELADHLQARARDDELRLREFEGLLGISSQLRLETLDRELRGQRLQQVAIELLEREVGPGTPIHYRDWFERLRDRGHRVSGRNPLANFLAQVSRAPRVEPVGSRTGLYVLREAA